MESNYIYGVVVSNIFYSNRMEFKTNQDNGIYSIDMSQDDFRDTISTANIENARNFFRKSSKIDIIRGISFHNGIVPENPIAYSKIPLNVIDATYDEFEEVEVALIRGKICYFLQTINTSKAYPILDIKQRFEEKDVFDGKKLIKRSNNIDDIKGVTPEMRIVYILHLIERAKKEVEEPVNAIKRIMEESGAIVNSVKKTNRGFHIIWKCEGHTINTIVDKNFRVENAGFCTSGGDKSQSASSVVKLLKDYVEEGSRIHLTLG